MAAWNRPSFAGGLLSRPQLQRQISRRAAREMAELEVIESPEELEPEDEEEVEIASPRGRGPVSLVPSLFPLYLVKDSAVAWRMSSMIIRHFQGSGKVQQSRFVDLRATTPESRGKILFLLGNIPKDFNAALQVLPRKVDKRFGARIICDFPVQQDPDPLVFVVGKGSDPSKLALAMRARMIDKEKRQTCSTILLEINNEPAASCALMAIETLIHETWREVTVTVDLHRRTILNEREGTLKNVSSVTAVVTLT